MLLTHQLVGELKCEIAGADNQRGARALQLAVVATRDVLQRQVGGGLQGEAEHRPGQGDFTGEHLAGLGDEGEHGQPGQQQQPAAEQAGHAGEIAVLLVVDAEQGVGGDRGEQGKYGEDSVLGAQFTGLEDSQGE
ncbi:hypothetical protein D3C81_1578080 [compost metagenome]